MIHSPCITATYLANFSIDYSLRYVVARDPARPVTPYYPTLLVAFVGLWLDVLICVFW